MGNRIRSFLVYVGLGMLLLTSLNGYSQTLRKHNWYFGSTQNSIRFNRVTNDPTLVTNKAIPFGTGGSAVATDPGNGNLLFYTDGKRIYDKDHKLMFNGDNLNGNENANSPAAITPVPDQPGKFFVFTNTATYTTPGTVYYTIVDMTRFGSSTFPSPPNGEVTSKNNPVPGLNNVSEGMIVLPQTDGNDYWLITQRPGTSTFTSTRIAPASFTGTFNSTVTTGATPAMTVGAFGYHEGLKKLAAAPQVAGVNALIMDFNETDGSLTFGLNNFIFNSAIPATTEPQAIYDIEWSVSGRYLYLSVHGDVGVNANVLQYDFQNQNITLQSVLPSPIFRSYGLQLGPDSLVYHMYQSSAAGPFLLGRIKYPDSVATRTRYEVSPNGFAGTDFGGTQFPGFVPRDTVRLTADFTIVGTCEKSPTTFHPIVSPNADSLTWAISDGTNISGWSPKRTFAQAGTYNITMTAHYRGQTQTAQHSVTIRSFPLTLQLVQDTTACRGEFPPPRGTSSPKQFSVPLKVQGGTPASIVWSNGDLGMTLTPDSAGYYYVVVTDAGGCSGYAGVNVREYGLQSQQLNKWYFGKNAGINFTPNPPVALNESAMDAPEGVAIACDRNGDQLFYTDGSTVWNRTHQVIETNIGGNPRATQSAMIVPVPGDETLFYIFTTEDMNGSDMMALRYSMFDLKGNNGTGQVIPKSIFMYMKNTERITATNNVLLVHELGNSTFRAYPIDSIGLGNPIYTDIGTNHVASIPRNVDGYMKIGPGNLIAAPISTPGVDSRIELFKLDSTGTVTTFQTINLNDANGAIYGVEFSSTGKKLFASVRYGSNSAIYEYAIDATTLAPTFIQRIPVAADLGAIQIAPNGQILVAVNNSGANTSLGTIIAVEDNNNPTAPSSFQLNGFPLASGTNSWLGLPNFRQINSNPPSAPGLTVNALCSQLDSKFQGAGRDPNIEEYYFSVFRNGQLVASNNQQNTQGYPYNPEFSVNLPAGSYSVTLRLQNRCDMPLEFKKDFTITPPPFNPTQGVPFCNTPTVTLDANPGNVAGLSYQWATGETTETLVISDVGIYAVDITDAVGCKTRGTFLAADNRPKFDLGPDLTICQRENTPALNVQNNGLTIQWNVDGTPNGNTSSIQAIDVSTVRTITYGVRVTEPTSGCFKEDEKQYTINVAPDPQFLATAASACGAKDGAVQLTLTGTTPAGGPYSYFVSGPDIPSGGASGLDAASGSSFTFNALGSGTYTAIVRDQINGCTQQKSAGISDATYTILPAVQAPNCDPVIVQVTVSGTTVNAANPLDFKTTNSANGATQTSGTSTNAVFNTTLPQGSYTIEVTDVNNCVQTQDITITPNPKITVTLTPDLCALTLTANGPAGTTYAWTATPANGINGSASGATISLGAGNRDVTYSVTATNSGAGCPAVEETTLFVGNGILPGLSQSDGCTDLATITAVPNGNFTYYWYVNGATAPDPGLGGSSITATRNDNGNSYIVQVYEPQSGCRRDSNPLIVQIVGEVDALLASTPPCDDGQPITLTATTTDPTGAAYAWTRDGSALTDVNTATTNQTAEGRYEVKISKGSCSATASLLIDRAPLPVGLLDNRNVICDDDENTDPTTRSVDLDPGAFVSYDWLKNGVSLNYNQRVLTADSKGKYSVMITDARGCTGTDEIDILNDCLPRLNAPNAFRPGSDNNFVKDHPELTNANFWVISKFIEDDNFKVFIFNRWGEMVYSSTDRFFKWNGGYNNDLSRPLPPGTYSYVVQYKSTFRPQEGVKEKRGGVALIR